MLEASVFIGNASRYEHVLDLDLQFDRKRVDLNRDHPRRNINPLSPIVAKMLHLFYDYFLQHSLWKLVLNLCE